MVLYDVGSAGRVDYAVAELLEGETLRDRLSRGPLPWRKAAELGAAIAEGLSAAHSKGVVHRDIKPANIFLTTDGRVKILDFGLAQVASAPRESEDTATLTEAGPTVMGTIGYMSPEQVRGEKIEAASDIFSLGCVLYEAVTGLRAFRGESATETMAAILRDEPPTVADAGNVTPPDLDRVIERCLAKSPAQRFHSAHDLAFALRSLSSSSAGEHRPIASPARIDVRRAASVVALVILALAGAAFYFLRGSGTAIDSLAVLPFANGGGGEDADWLSDGITESLIGSLVAMPGLKVMSRNAVFRYKGKETDARQAASQLGVRAVLTGRVVEHGAQLSVSAELVDARDGSELVGREIRSVDVRYPGGTAGYCGADLGEAPCQAHGRGKAEVRQSRSTDNPEAYQLLT